MKNRVRKLLAGVLLAGMVFGSMPVYGRSGSGQRGGKFG